MSWAEVKKINSDLSTSLDARIDAKTLKINSSTTKPLDTLIGEKTTEIKNSVNSKPNYTELNYYTRITNGGTVSGVSGWALVVQGSELSIYNGSYYEIYAQAPNGYAISVCAPLAANKSYQCSSGTAYIYSYGGGS